jgi:hypothetical protein
VLFAVNLNRAKKIKPNLTYIMAIHRNKAMKKSVFAKEVGISPRTLLRDAVRAKEAILKLDPDYFDRNNLLPIVVDFFADKYFGTKDFKIYSFDELPDR